MNETELLALLENVAAGKESAGQALSSLMKGPFFESKLSHSTVDHHRVLRHGVCEVIYGESKTAEQICDILKELSVHQTPVLVTRVDATKRSFLKKTFPHAIENELGRTFLLNAPKSKSSTSGEPFVALVSAGTSDAPVMEEAAAVCVAMGVAFERVCDVGVAGIHRLLAKVDFLNQAAALVVIAGMEGALPSVVAGLVGKPIFAVPTSVGYGANLGGITALLAMLNSCGSGVTVTNIDAGFSGAYAACQVVRAIKGEVLKNLERATK